MAIALCPLIGRSVPLLDVTRTDLLSLTGGGSGAPRPALQPGWPRHHQGLQPMSAAAARVGRVGRPAFCRVLLPALVARDDEVEEANISVPVPCTAAVMNVVG